MSTAVAIATGAGQGVGGGIAIWAGFRFVRWLAEFVTGRIDRRADRIEQREKELEERFNSRLRHVEQELDRYRDATMHLVNALAERDPSNKALKDVARILRTATPMASPDADLDQLLQSAGDAVDRTRGEGSNAA